MSIENLINTLDENKDGKLEKDELEKIGLKLTSLKEKVIDNKLNELAPNYENDFKNIKDIEIKKDYLVIFFYAKKILGENFYKEFLAKGGKYSDVPLNEMISFIGENLLNEKNLELLKTKEIILTTDELEELHKILIKTKTKKDIKDFINKQLNENITSAEIIQGTSFEEKLKNLGKNPNQFMKNIDTVWYEFLKSKLENISEDVLRNIATGMTFTFIKLFNDVKGQIPNYFDFIKNPNNLKNFKIENKAFFEQTSKIIKIINTMFTNMNKKDQEKNAILMDSQKFSSLYYSFLKGKIEKKEVENKLTAANGKYQKEERSIQELKDIADKAAEYINQENIKGIGKIATLGETLNKIKESGEKFKSKIKNITIDHADEIFSLKSFFEGLGIFKYIKDLFDKILKLLGFENGWNSFEKEIEKRKFPYVLKYLKENITIKNIQTEAGKKSIFYAGFKENLENAKNEEKIKKLKVKGKLSYESLKYLQQLGSNGNLEENLNNFFSSENFNKLFKNKDQEKEFYKNAFKIETLTQENKNLKTKINMGVIDFDKIDEVIKKLYEEKEKEKEKKKDNPQDNINNYGDIYTINIKSLEEIKIGQKEKKLLDFIGKYESGGNYNAIYGDPNQNKIKFTKMTLKEVIENRKKAVKNGSKSSAVGKYQFLAKTLEDIIKRYNINENTKFSPEIQDKLAMLKLKERGYDAFLNGKTELEKFIENLSKEWASIPKDASGETFYNKNGLNKALVSYNDTKNLVNSIRTA